MTDDRSPIDDELVSAVLDGEATDDERALVEGSVEGRRRLDQMRAAAEMVAAAPAPLDPRSVDAMVGRALDAAVPASRVDELAGRRARRSGAAARWRQGLAVAAAAVAAIVLFGGIAVLAGRSSTQSASDSGADASSAELQDGAADGGSTAAPTADAAESATSATGIPLDLGTLTDGAAALAAWDGRVLDGSGVDWSARAALTGPSTTFGAGLGCALPPFAPLAGETWAVVATALLPTGAAVVVADVAALPDGRVAVVDATTCAVLASGAP